MNPKQMRAIDKLQEQRYYLESNSAQFSLVLNKLASLLYKNMSYRAREGIRGKEMAMMVWRGQNIGT
jgi:hypothetical protein